MYQETMIIANLGSDGEMRYTANGTPVVNFRAAVNRSWVGQDGQKQEKTTWFRINYWGKAAEAVVPYLTKGKLVMVKGELEDPKPYQAKDGSWVASLEIKANSIKLLGGSGGNAANHQATSGGASQSHDDAPVDLADVPF